MAMFEVRLEVSAVLRPMVEVEAVDREQAYRKVFSWGRDELDGFCEDEMYSLTGDVEILSIEEVEG